MTVEIFQKGGHIYVKDLAKEPFKKRDGILCWKKVLEFWVDILNFLCRGHYFSTVSSNSV